MNHTIALIIVTLIGPIIGYLSGSVLWSVILGKKIFDKDVREFASKNAGATNTSRVLGKKMGVLVLVLDVLKSYVPTMIIWLISRYCFKDSGLRIDGNFNEFSLVYLTSIFAILGHCYPVWFKFKGGKGVSCFGGMILAISPFLALVSGLVFLVILFWKKYVSLASMIGSASTFIFMLVPGINWMYMTNEPIQTLNLVNGYNYLSIILVFVICLIGSVIIISKHHENIKRLINGKERKASISWLKY